MNSRRKTCWLRLLCRDEGGGEAVYWSGEGHAKVGCLWGHGGFHVSPTGAREAKKSTYILQLPGLTQDATIRLEPTGCSFSQCEDTIIPVQPNDRGWPEADGR